MKSLLKRTLTRLKKTKSSLLRNVAHLRPALLPETIITPTGSHLVFGDFSVLPRASGRPAQTILGWSMHGIIQFQRNNVENTWKAPVVIPGSESYIQIGNKKTLVSHMRHPIHLVPAIIHGILKRKGHIVGYLRPFVFRDKHTYSLLHQKITFTLEAGRISPTESVIELRCSKNGNDWSAPVTLFDDHRFAHISSPCLYFDGTQYVLYFTHGILYPGHSFMEPKYLGYATSKTLKGPYIYQREVTIWNKQKTRRWKYCGTMRLRTTGQKTPWAVANQITVRSDGTTQSMLHALRRVNNHTFVDLGHFLSHTQRADIHATDVYIADLLGDNTVALNARVTTKPNLKPAKPALNILDHVRMVNINFRHFKENLYIYRLTKRVSKN